MDTELAEQISLLAAPIYAQMHPSETDPGPLQQAKREAAIRWALALWKATLASTESGQ